MDGDTVPTRGRSALSRERVLSAAVTLADAQGIGALTIRALAAELGARPMSLYHYVRDKEEILDALVDGVFAEIDLPPTRGGWRDRLRARAISTRSVLLRHPWALGLMETRTTPGPATLRHHDAVLGLLRGAGFSLPATARAYATLDAYVYGFVLQEVSLPFEGDASTAEVAESVLGAMGAMGPDGYPHLVEFMAEHALQPGYSFAAEFEPGLDLVLAGIARLRRG